LALIPPVSWEIMPFKLPQDFESQIIEQAKAEHPNEACGLIGGSDGHAKRLFRMTNAERSPVIYRMEPTEQLRVFNEIDADGLDLVAIYHSHTRSPAYPSSTDVSLAYYPEAVYLIVSLADMEKPDLRGFRIQDGKVTEIEVELE
jgi:[CysO sulfur-carrier protein]-S-L-cysteine hydrolase